MVVCGTSDVVISSQRRSLLTDTAGAAGESRIFVMASGGVR
jgi:hypothetical protein